MTHKTLRTRVEQIRQARQIHGGVVNMCAAALAVRLSRVPIPTKRLRTKIFRTIFGKKYPALDENEFERPIWEYRSFNALFTRGVRPEFRPISQVPHQFLCPCDGRIQDVGTVTGDRIVTVKGVEYTIASLLPHIDAAAFHGGQFSIIFLSPSDCHRVFAAHDGMLEQVVHVPGSRLLVHPPFQRKEFPVFALNERVIFRFATEMGSYALVMVAGWGVGNITLPVDRGFRPGRRELTQKHYTPPMPVRRGDWIGTFELGSTVIVITEPGAGMVSQVRTDDKVRYGQPLFGVSP